MAAQRVAHCCSCCLLPNTSCSNRHDTSSCCRLNSCNNCFPPPEARTAVEKEEECRFSPLSLSLSSELSCRGCRPQLHILVLSRNPFSRLGCHRHIKSPNSGPHWAIMGIVVFLGWFLGFLGPRESAGCHFLLCRHLLRNVSHARGAAVGPRLRLAMCCEAATLTAHLQLRPPLPPR